MKVVKTNKGESWPVRLMKLEIDDILPVDIKSAKSVRGAISRELPDSGITRKFKTKKERDSKNRIYLKVWRTA